MTVGGGGAVFQGTPGNTFIPGPSDAAPQMFFQTGIVNVNSKPANSYEYAKIFGCGNYCAGTLILTDGRLNDQWGPSTYATIVFQTQGRVAFVNYTVQVWDCGVT
jgi:hypothetical protein